MGRRANPTNPACPIPQHSGSRVAAHGVYRPAHGGRPCTHHARVRYRCRPKGLPPHTFSTGRRLPRDGDCDECIREFHRYDGPPAPRGFMHVTNDITRGLMYAGEGHSYAKAGRLVRAKSQVIRFHPKRAKQPEWGGTDWGLVADWVELYSRVVTKGALLEEWPAAGLIVDQVTFAAGTQWRNDFSGRIQIRTSWSIICGMAPYGPGNRLRMVLMRAYPSKSGNAAYEHFFRQLAGQPAFIVSDRERAIVSASQKVWPGIVNRYAFDKLDLMLTDLLMKNRLRGDTLWDLKGQWDSRDKQYVSIFKDQARWNRWIAEARARRADPFVRDIADWADAYEPLVLAQLGAMPYWPNEAAPLEHAQEMLRNSFKLRSFVTRNQIRTNLLLDLMTAHLAERANHKAYTLRLRAFLEQGLGTIRRHGVYHGPQLH